MEFWQSVASNFLGGLLVAIVSGTFAFIVRSKQGEQKRSSEVSGLGLATVVDDFVERQRKISRRHAQSQQSQPLAKRVVVEHREACSSSSTDEGLGIIFLVVVIVGFLDSLWTKYKIPIFYASMVVIGIGLGISIYYIVQLRKMNPPYQLEDYSLSWGSFVIWIISATTSWLAVYNPLYKEPIMDSPSLNLLFVHAGQLVGMVLLFIAIILTALTQYTAGHIYQNALQSRPPNRFEIYIWEKRSIFFIIILVSTIIAFILSTGVFF